MLHELNYSNNNDHLVIVSYLVHYAFFLGYTVIAKRHTNESFVSVIDFYSHCQMLLEIFVTLNLSLSFFFLTGREGMGGPYVIIFINFIFSYLS